MTRLIITGACGRTGSAILKLAAGDPDFDVVHIVEAQGHPLAGTAIALPGIPGTSLVLETDLEKVIGETDVVIDFTEPVASFLHFKAAAAHGKAIILGTTGFSAETMAEMRGLAGVRAVISPNMSIGVNVLFNLAKKAAEALGPNYDTEIVEMHHKWKKDAPSGTAVKLKEMVMSADPARLWVEISGRKGITGERAPGEIGVLAVRAGDIVGEHTVFFVGTGERLEITHRAFSRDNFARGALAAARWIARQPKGIYDMNDVLSLT
jgi:4-hydroxy-tetrahydrodipicolinate reductase